MTKESTSHAQSDDYKNLVDLLSVYSEAAHRLGEMEANMNSDLMGIIDTYKGPFAKTQRAQAEAEQAMEVLARRNMEWFKDLKGLKTPYGTVKFHHSTALEVANEELSIVLVEREAAKHGLDAELLIRTVRELNLDAMKSLTDDELKVFRIRRTPRENFSVAPAKVDLGKAIKQGATSTQSQIVKA